MTRKDYNPRPYAELAMAHLVEHERCALWAKPGMGKTVITETFIKGLHAWGETHPVLVIAPKRVARDTWSTESVKWNHLAGLDVAQILGTEAERLNALRLDRPVYTTNYENLPWLTEKVGTKWPWQTIVADEATKLKNFRLGGAKNVRSKALGRVAHRFAKRFIELSGTPAPNGLLDLWGQLYFIDAGARLGRTFTAFRDRYFYPEQTMDKSGSVYLTWKALPASEELIMAKVKDVALTLDPKDWFPLKEPVVNNIYVDLPVKARAVYDEFEKEMFAQLRAGTNLEVHNKGQVSMKCRQIANGAVYYEGKQWALTHEEKVDALEELAEATGSEPLLVAYEFKQDKAIILDRFPDALDIAQEAEMQAAKHGHGKIWLCNPAAVAHGIDGLQACCNNIVFFSLTWNLELHDQVIERVGPMRQFQIGHEEPMFIHYILAKRTVDGVMRARLTSKAGVQAALLDYMAKGPEDL